MAWLLAAQIRKGAHASRPDLRDWSKLSLKKEIEAFFNNSFFPKKSL